MHKGRLEAFSDGVLAIIITIMVLELKVPHGPELSELKPLVPIFVSYLLSFVFVGIYWNNHHHLLQAAHKVNGTIMWANLHLLFWLSLIPFTTGWMGENDFQTWPVIVYGVNLFFAGFAYFILERSLISHHGHDSKLANALRGKELKDLASIVIYALAIGLAFFSPGIAYSLYAVVAIIWLVPDKRIEKTLGS